MALPRFHSTLLVFPALLGVCISQEQAYKLQGGCEIEDAGCLDIDQDDTGLMQSPLRKTVEVTKVRGVVGSAVVQEGSTEVPSAPQAKAAPPEANSQNGDLNGGGVQDPTTAHAASTAGAGASAALPLLSVPRDAAATSSSSGAASMQPDVVTATVQDPEAATAAFSAAATAGAVAGDARQQGSVAAESQQVEASDNAAQMGLSFFQVGQEKDSESNAQEAAQADGQDPDARSQQDDLDMERFLADDDAEPITEGVEDPVTDGAAEDSTVTTVQDDGPGWTSKAVEFGGASLPMVQFLLLIVAVALVVNSMLRWHTGGLRPRDALSAKMRKKLERMPVATGLEVRSFCAVDGGSADRLIPGVLMRIQGRVVANGTAPLVAPLSGRSCVLYSASVSQHRHDGVHQPPVAFASAARDFTVQLEDCPEMLLEINSEDVIPFDMQVGRYACELAFGDAPDSWRGFMLDNLTPGVEGCGAKGQLMNRVDLGAKGPLNFRECGLVLGSRVTCIGEVVREHNGKLRLSPWSPPPPQDALGEPTKSKTRAWLTPEADPWLHKLMISDDSRLLVEASQLPLPGKCRSCS